MIQNTFWENGRLVRKCYDVTGEKPGALAYGLTLTMIGLAVMLFSLGCGSADDYHPTELSPEPQHESFPEPEAVVEAPVAEHEQDPLRLTPDAELADEVAHAASVYLARLGIEIEIAEGGIPVEVRDEVHSGGRVVDALAENDATCTFSECNAPRFGARVFVARDMLTTKSKFLRQTVEHEIGHIVSGWGHAYGGPSHLADDATHLMSPGCRKGVCGPWSAEDAGMFCAGAPCTKMDLTAQQ